MIPIECRIAVRRTLRSNHVYLVYTQQHHDNKIRLLARRPKHFKANFEFQGWWRNCEKRLLPSVRLSACNSSAPIGRIFVRFHIWRFFENLPRENSKLFFKSEKS